MNVQSERGLFRGPRQPAPFKGLASEKSTAPKKPAQSEGISPLQTLRLEIKDKILHFFPGKTFSKDLLKMSQYGETRPLIPEPSQAKLEALFRIIDALDSLQARLLHKENHDVFWGERRVKALANKAFSESMTNLKNELSHAMALCPLDASQLNAYVCRADLIKEPMNAFFAYAKEFKAKRLHNVETNQIVVAEITRLVTDIVNDMKQMALECHEEIPDIERWLKLFLATNKPLMRYECQQTGWLLYAQTEYKALSFEDKWLSEGIGRLCSSFYKEYATTGIALDLKISAFPKEQQHLLEEIEARLNIIRVFPMLPESYVPASSVSLN